MATKIYIGTKIVKAEPMTNTEFAGTIRRLGEDDWSTSPGYKVIYEDGYVSWSPKETFERAYREVTNAEARLFIGTPVS